MCKSVIQYILNNVFKIKTQTKERAQQLIIQQFAFCIIKEKS